MVHNMIPHTPGVEKENQEKYKISKKAGAVNG